MRNKTDTRPRASSRPSEDLPYRIDLWETDGDNGVERVLARAASMQLARAIFKAAQSEHPHRRMTLSRATASSPIPPSDFTTRAARARYL